MASLRQVGMYATVLSMASQSARWQRQADMHLLQMTSQAARSASLETASSESAAKSAKDWATAEEDEASAEELREQAAALERDSAAHHAHAAEEEASAEALEATAAEEELAADADLAAAAAAEAEADASEAGAAEATAAVAADQAAELEDAVAVAACEAIPLVDIACDVIGATAAAGLEADAVAEAAVAAAEVAAALAAREEEAAEVAEAAAQQSAAAADAEAAAEAHAEAAEDEAAAEAETAQAAALVGDAEALEAAADEAGVKASTADASAAAEQDEAERAAALSLEHGLQAAFNSLWSFALGVGAAVYFMGRLAIRFFWTPLWNAMMATSTATTATGMFLVQPSPTTASSTAMLLPGGASSSCSFCSSVGKFFSYSIVHISVFAASAMTVFGAKASSLSQYSAQSIGGLLLFFGFLGGTVHCVVLKEWFLLSWFFWIPVFVMEALIVWLNVGRHYNPFALEQDMWKWLLGLWMVVLILTMVHHGVHPTTMPTEASNGNSNGNSSNVEATRPVANEKTPLLSIPPEKTDVVVCCQEVLEEHPTLWQHMKEDWAILHAALTDYAHKLQLPFEVLAVSIMVAVLSSCLKKTRVLSPLIQKFILPKLVSRRMVMIVSTSLAVLLVVMVAVCCWRRRRRRRNTSPPEANAAREPSSHDEKMTAAFVP